MKGGRLDKTMPSEQASIADLFQKYEKFRPLKRRRMVEVRP
jgi:hypothetical protein